MSTLASTTRLQTRATSGARAMRGTVLARITHDTNWAIRDGVPPLVVAHSVKAVTSPKFPIDSTSWATKRLRWFRVSSRNLGRRSATGSLCHSVADVDTRSTRPTAMPTTW